MNNLLSYCGLTDARMRASEKDLTVCGAFFISTCKRTRSYQIGKYFLPSLATHTARGVKVPRNFC